MSIVERALQKARDKAKAAAATDTPVATQVAPAQEQPVVPEPVVTAAPNNPAVTTSRVGTAETSRDEELSLTSRDLKAIVPLDFAKLRAAGRLPSEEMSDQLDDEIRRIKWPLLKSIEGGEGVRAARNNLVLVTSALPGEGKTFTSLNLALSIVRDREMRVVLVDGDVARPGLTPAVGLDNRPGLNDALEDESRDINSVTYQTDVEGLYFVPAGKWNPHAPEYFAGSRMPLLMQSLSRRVGRGVVIFDSPPLLATNEAQVATRFAGQVLLVVRAESTQQRAVLDALALIDSDVPVSAVLNDCKPSLLTTYYGQYYYGKAYGYGQAYSDHTRRGRRA
jgi:receptor protein-tyrosine kinase